MTNYPKNPAANGIYENPLNGYVVTKGQCNYAPQYPCGYQDKYSEVVLETAAFNQNESGLVASINKIAANTGIEALETDVVLDPALTGAQKQAISDTFYAANQL